MTRERRINEPDPSGINVATETFLEALIRRGYVQVSSNSRYRRLAERAPIRFDGMQDQCFLEERIDEYGDTQRTLRPIIGDRQRRQKR